MGSFGPQRDSPGAVTDWLSHVGSRMLPFRAPALLSLCLQVSPSPHRPRLSSGQRVSEDHVACPVLTRLVPPCVSREQISGTVLGSFTLCSFPL